MIRGKETSQKKLCQLKHVLCVSAYMAILSATLVGAFCGMFYSDSPSGDTCWAIKSWSKGHYSRERDLWYKGLAGTHTELAWEDDSDFASLYGIHATILAVGALGLVVAVNEKCSSHPRRKNITDAPGSYVSALTLYFSVAFVVHFVTQLCFVRNRCHDHNVRYASMGEVYVNMLERGWVRKPHSWSDELTTSAAWTKTLYLAMIFNGGFVTNVLAQLTLLYRASTIDGVSNLPSVKIAIILAKVCLVLSVVMLPATIAQHLRMMHEGVSAIGGEDVGDSITTVFNVVAACYVASHVYISLVVTSVFSSTMKRHLRSLAQVTICTCVISFSTLLCYGNMAVMILNAYKVVPLDALVSHVCMIAFHFTSRAEGRSSCEAVEADELNSYKQAVVDSEVVSRQVNAPVIPCLESGGPQLTDSNRCIDDSCGINKIPPVECASSGAVSVELPIEILPKRYESGSECSVQLADEGVHEDSDRTSVPITELQLGVPLPSSRSSLSSIGNGSVARDVPVTPIEASSEQAAVCTPRFEV